MRRIGFVSLALTCLACGGLPTMFTEAVLFPEFVLVSGEGNDACSTMFDYCMRVRCTVQNIGKGAGLVTVDLMMLDGSGAPIAVDSQSVAMRPGDYHTFEHDFREAKLFGNQSKYNCVLRQ